MTKIIEFESENGVILVETVETNNNVKNFGTTKETITEKAKYHFENSIEVIKNVSDAIVQKIYNSATGITPDEIEVKLGLKFTAEAGAIIAKTSTEGNLEVIIKWTKSSKDKK